MSTNPAMKIRNEWNYVCNSVSAQYCLRETEIHCAMSHESRPVSRASFCEMQDIRSRFSETVCTEISSPVISVNARLRNWSNLETDARLGNGLRTILIYLYYAVHKHFDSDQKDLGSLKFISIKSPFAYALKRHYQDEKMISCKFTVVSVCQLFPVRHFLPLQ